MRSLYRPGLLALIVLVNAAPVRGQQQRVVRDSILIERTASPERTTVILRRTGPDGQTRTLTGDSARAWMRDRAPMRDRRFEDKADMVSRDSLRTGRMAYRVRLDSLTGSRMRMRLAPPVERRMGGALPSEGHGNGDVRVFRFNGPPGMAMDGPAMRSRMEGRPGVRMRRMAPGMGGGMILEREVRRTGGDSTVIIERRRAPGMDGRLPRRPMLQRRLRGEDGPAEREENVRIERDGEGRVRVYRFENGGPEERPAPGLRVEGRPGMGERMIRLNRDGQVIEGGGAGVRVERDADGGLRIYLPPASPNGEAPAPRRPAPRARRN